MLIFALDTSGPVAGVALLEDGVVRYEAMARNKMTHSQSIMPLTEEAFLHTGLTMGQVDYFAVTVGPGSFTGVRIGVATIKAMAHAQQKPCIALNALEVMARGVALFEGVACPIQDARAGQVYGAAFDARRARRLMADAPLKVEDYIEAILKISLDKPLIFTGDGVPVHQEKITALLGARATFAPPTLMYPRPAEMAALAQEKVSEAIPFAALSPLYLRAPQAERQRNLVGEV